jgi:hypothetical protein
LIFYVNKTLISPFRTHRLAHGRNYCLDYVKTNKEMFPYFIMMDLDDVNCKNLNIEPLRRSLKRTDWDGLSFNTSPHYYDVWGLSIKPYYFSYNHFNYNSTHNAGLIGNYVDKILKTMPKNKLLPCLSSFNGFSSLLDPNTYTNNPQCPIP